ncbi:MAG: cytosine permease [Oscillospiraceae bacterium]
MTDFKNSKKQQKTDKDYSLEPVPEKARNGFWNICFVMVGFTFFSASMSVGAKLGNGLLLSSFIGAVVIGGVILSVYCGILAYIGCDTGMSIDLLAKYAFGIKGSYIPSGILSFTQIGWFGVGVAMFAIPASDILGVNPWVLVIASGLCMTGSTYFGMKALAIVSYISVPLIAILGSYSMVTSTVDGGGLTEIFSQSSGLNFITAIGMVIGSFISGGTATPNFVRFAKNNKSAVLTTVIAFFIGNSLMFAFGAVGGAFTKADDIFYVMIAQGLALPALIVLGANIWTTNGNALYTSGLGLSNITGLKRKPMVLVAGIIGTFTSIWLYNNFIGWLNFLNVALPPIGIIVMIDFFKNKKSYKTNETETKSIKIFSVLGVILGALIANFVTFGIAAINAMVVAAICYFVGEAINKR